MKELRARDVLVNVRAVAADDRAAPLRNDATIFAVFVDEPPRLSGLVTARAIARAPQRIFADLVPLEPQAQIAADESAERAAHQLEEASAEALAVVAPDGTLLGAATRASVLRALLLEERRLHDVLRLDDARIKALLAAIPDRIMVLDASGRYLERDGGALTDSALAGDAPASAAAQRPRDAAPRSLDDELSAEDAARVRAAVTACLAGGGLQMVSARVGAPGAAREYELRIAPLDPALALCVARDVTETNRLRAQLIFADRMAAIGTLAAGVAHEINNPLAYILANVELLAAGLAERAASTPSPPPAASDAPAPSLTPPPAALLDEIREGLARIRTIVSDLKTVGRNDGDARSVVDVRRVVAVAVNVARPHFRHRVTLVEQIGDDVGHVEGAEARLVQVFVNLLINAAQATRGGAPGGQRIEVSAYRQGGEVHVVVADNGVGLAAAARERAFDAFFTTKQAEHGTGLGLFISHSIVTTFGGRIFIEDGIDGGCAFHVVLPAARAPAPTPLGAFAPAPAPAPPGAFAPVHAPAFAARLLIVDDEPSILRSLPPLLRPHAVTVAPSGAAALDALAEGGPFDAVVCDVMMPGMSGIEFFRLLCERLPAMQHRFIFMTGGAHTAAVHESLASTGAPVLEKPFRRAQLLEALDALLARVGRAPG